MRVRDADLLLELALGARPLTRGLRVPRMEHFDQRTAAHVVRSEVRDTRRPEREGLKPAEARSQLGGRRRQRGLGLDLERETVIVWAVCVCRGKNLLTVRTCAHKDRHADTRE